jgi:hypothetical protein
MSGIKHDGKNAPKNVTAFILKGDFVAEQINGGGCPSA